MEMFELVRHRYDLRLRLAEEELDWAELDWSRIVRVGGPDEGEP